MFTLTLMMMILASAAATNSQDQTVYDDGLELPDDVKTIQNKYLDENSHLSTRALPSSSCYKIKAIFNRRFCDRFRSISKASQMIKSIVALANSDIFTLPGLSTRFILDLQGEPIFDSSAGANTWGNNTNSARHDTILNRVNRDPQRASIQHYAFFTMPSPGADDRGTKDVWRGTACLKYFHDFKVSVNELSGSLLDMATTLARRIGYTLNMLNDNVVPCNNCTIIPRRDQSGRPCSGVSDRRGVMGYPNNPNFWSTCSNEELKKYLGSYNNCFLGATCSANCMDWEPSSYCNDVKKNNFCSSKYGYRDCRFTCSLCNECKDTESWCNTFTKCDAPIISHIYCPLTCNSCTA